MILAREDGAIIQTSGLLSHDDVSELGGGYRSPDNTEKPKTAVRSAGIVAQTVMTFFNAAGSLVKDLLQETDGVKLLRLRTKKNELVLVPGIRSTIEPVPPAQVPHHS